MPGVRLALEALIKAVLAAIGTTMLSAVLGAYVALLVMAFRFGWIVVMVAIESLRN